MYGPFAGWSCALGSSCERQSQVRGTQLRWEGVGVQRGHAEGQQVNPTACRHSSGTPRARCSRRWTGCEPQRLPTSAAASPLHQRLHPACARRVRAGGSAWQPGGAARGRAHTHLQGCVTAAWAAGLTCHPSTCARCTRTFVHAALALLSPRAVCCVTRTACPLSPAPCTPAPSLFSPCPSSPPQRQQRAA